MNEKTLGLIGFGKWGKNLARNFHQLGVLHTICDTFVDDIPYRDVFLERDPQTLFSHPKISTIIIATPPDSHYALAKSALLAGKDVFVEKPLCFDVGEAKELHALAQENGLILMVGHLLHYHPCIHQIKNLISEGAIGHIRYVSSHRFGPGYIRQENALWDLVPHDISVLMALCGNELPVSVQCQGAVSLTEQIMDTVMVCLEFESSIKAHIHASWIYPNKEQKLTVIGTKGSLIFDDVKPWPEKLIFQRLKKNVLTQEDRVVYETTPILVEQQEPLMNECRHFMQCCALRKNPITSGFEALQVIQVLEKIEKQMLESFTLF